MRAKFKPLSRPIVTMGPRGTDAASLAAKLSKQVTLVGSFREAMEHSCASGALALLPCGYLVRGEGASGFECWVDLNFEYAGRLRILRCFPSPTKTMCLAQRKSCAEPKSVALHPATKVFADRFAPDKELSFVNNKPLAVEECAAGKYDMCVGSLDVVRSHESLRVLRVFRPEMVWVLYTRVRQ